MKPLGKTRFLIGNRTTAMLITATISTSALHAADGTWIGTTSADNWSNTANWASGTVANGSGSTADFSTLDLPAGAFAVTVDSAHTVGHLKFNDTDNTTAGTWSIAMGGFLTLSSPATISTNVDASLSGSFATQVATDSMVKQGAAVLNLSGVGATAWAGTLNIASGAVQFKGNASSQATVAGAITGPGEMRVVQGSTATFQQLSDISGFTGTITCQSGNFRYGTSSAAPTAAQANGSQALFDLGAGGRAFYRNGTSGTVTIRMGALTGTSGSSLAGGNSAGGGTVLFQVGEKNIASDFGGSIQDGLTKSGLTKSGTATLTLSGTSSHTGLTTVSTGTLKLTGTKTGTGATTVASGATLTGTTLGWSGTTTIQSGGILEPGDSGVGEIFFTSLTLNAGSILKLDFGSGVNDTVYTNTGGVLTINNGATVDVQGFGTNGTYHILDYSGTVSGSAATALSVVNGASGKFYSFVDDGAGSIDLTISSTSSDNFWKPDADGTWNNATNWTAGSIPNAAAAVAKVGQGPQGLGGAFTNTALNVTLDGNKTVGTLQLNDTTGTAITIDQGTSGTLTFNNNSASAILSNAAGNHTINAPLALASGKDLTADVSATYTLTTNGSIAGGSTSLITKSGDGTLLLAGTNTYSGGTVLSAGNIAINSSDSLGAATGQLTFSGGTLTLADTVTSGETRDYVIANTFNANINTNGFDLYYDGVVSSDSATTGGIVKSGAGVLYLGASPTCPGVTSITGGTISLPSGVALNSSNLSLTTGGILDIDGGSFTDSDTANASSLVAGTLNLLAGSATFNGGFNANTGNTTSNYLLHLTGGTFTTTNLEMGRSATALTAEPAAGLTNVGLYVDGATANITGNLNVGSHNTNTNSSTSARIDSGSLNVTGTVAVRINNGGRWSVLHANGGTFTTGTSLTLTGGTGGGHALFLVTGGVSTVPLIDLVQPAVSTSSSQLTLTGGSLYVGSGGITGTNNGGTATLDIKLGGGVLGATADWTTTLAADLTGPATIQAADASSVAHNITFNGALTGVGSLVKTGTGTVTLNGANAYAGDTTVAAGTLTIAQLGLSDTANVQIDSGATLNLTFTGTDDIATININGDTSTGTWGAIGSGATHESSLITGTGLLNVTGTATSGYSTWAATNAGGQTADLDYDGDGVANGIEYFMGETGSTFTANPGIDSANKVTWPNGGNIDSANYGTEFTVQTSPDLINWTNVASGDSALTNNASGVSYQFAPSTMGAKKFARLKVTPN